MTWRSQIATALLIRHAPMGSASVSYGREPPLGRLRGRSVYLAGGWPLRRRGARRCGRALPVPPVVGLLDLAGTTFLGWGGGGNPTSL